MHTTKPAQEPKHLGAPEDNPRPKAGLASMSAAHLWRLEIEARAMNEEFDRNRLDDEFKRAQLAQWNKARSGITTKEKNSLLAIIAALAGIAEVDLARPHAKHGSAELIADKVNNTFDGIGITARTVADHLAAARDLPRK